MNKKNNVALSIIIPCLNEINTIENVIRRSFKAGTINFKKNFELIVADNGSTDGSLEKIKKSSKVRLVNVPIKGYGAALHWGILKSKAKYVFFADADMSYDFLELYKFLPYMGENYDLILGSRFKGKIYPGSMPFLNRYFGTPILTFLIRSLYGIKITDSNSGMRMIKKKFYNNLHMRNSGMEWDSELLIKTKLNKGKYAEVPISLYKDKRGSPPKLSRFVDGWRNLKTIFLIKPESMIIFIVIFLIVGISPYDKSFSVSFLFLMLAIVLAFSIVAAKMLNFAINKEDSNLVKFVNKLPIVFVAIIINVLSIISFFYLQDKYLKTELLLAGSVILLDMWIFLIETIKTHLINPLPENL